MSADKVKSYDEVEDLILKIVRKKKRHTVPLRNLQKAIAQEVKGSFSPSNTLAVLERLVAGGTLLFMGDKASPEYYYPKNLGYLKTRIREIVGWHHRNFPYEAGIRAGDIRKRISESQTRNSRRNIDPRLFELALSACKRDGLLIEAECGVRLFGFKPQSSTDEAFKKLEEELFRQIARRAHMRIDMEVLSHLLQADTRQIKAVISGMLKTGRLIRVGENRYLEPSVIANAKEALEALFTQRSRLHITEIAASIGLSRSAAVPLMTYLDGIGFTRRIGDVREKVRTSVKESSYSQDSGNGMYR